VRADRLLRRSSEGNRATSRGPNTPDFARLGRVAEGIASEAIETPARLLGRGRVCTKDKRQRQKKPAFSPTTKRLEALGTMRADILRCGIGSDACGSLSNKAAVVTEALVPLDKRDLFMEGAIALEALSETTNGDAGIVVMNSTFQSPKFC
jgi:hypothetical protein